MASEERRDWRTIKPLTEVVNNVEEDGLGENAIILEWKSASTSGQVNESMHENERMH